MNLLLVIGLSAVAGTGLGVLIYRLRKAKAAKAPKSPPEPKKSPEGSKSPRWIGIPLEANSGASARFCNTHAMTQFLVIHNKAKTRMRLKIFLVDGSIVYSPAVTTPEELDKQLNMIMAD